MKHTIDKTRLGEHLFSFIIYFLCIILIGFLGLIILFIISHSINYFSISVLFSDSPIAISDTEFFNLKTEKMLIAVGGIRSALVGTLFMTGLASLIAIPIGILIAIYLSEHIQSTLCFWILLITDTMQGIPSIIFGLIINIWIVQQFQCYSGLAGSFTLAIIMLPMIIQSTYEVLILIPKSIRESALALGVQPIRIILQIIIPSSFGGICSGILLAFSRIIGETAPLLFTAFGSVYFVTDIRQPMDSISMQIYRNTLSPNANLIANAWVSSFSLILMILFLNFVIKPLIDQVRIKF